MKVMIRIFIQIVLAVLLPVNACCFNVSVSEVAGPDIEYQAVDASAPVDVSLMTFAKSVILMEKSTGKVLYAENEHEKVFPASVTKIMTILLVCEAIENGTITLDDSVSCSDNASSKGGSQIWLEPGETMTVHELLKATCVYSANDACTLLGEYLAGSEASFNEMLNNRAKELGMENTHFDNCTGLDDTTDTHLTTAYDIALMSRELLKYDFIKEYTTIWMDSLRNGETQLVNTNKLIRYYEGITGLKTGTTDKAGCCVSATAERNGMELIAVVMGSENSEDRFTSARNLLDWGFANYELYQPQLPGSVVMTVPVSFGDKDNVGIVIPEIPSVLINKGKSAEITVTVDIVGNLEAPVAEGQKTGVVQVKSGDKIILEYDIVSAENISKLTFLSALLRLITSFS